MNFIYTILQLQPFFFLIFLIPLHLFTVQSFMVSKLVIFSCFFCSVFHLCSIADYMRSKQNKNKKTKEKKGGIRKRRRKIKNHIKMYTNKTNLLPSFSSSDYYIISTKHSSSSSGSSNSSSTSNNSSSSRSSNSSNNKWIRFI